MVEELNSVTPTSVRYAQGLGMDEPLAELRSGTTSFYEADGLGSVTSLSNSAGSVANTYIYDSFGYLYHSTGSVTNPYRFTAREFDTETGLYYYRARYYDPTVGRFLSEDPFAFLGGTNFYAYTLNDPSNLADPLGLVASCPPGKLCKDDAKLSAEDTDTGLLARMIYSEATGASHFLKNYQAVKDAGQPIGDAYRDERYAIAALVKNRIPSPDFPGDTVTSVIRAEGQFAGFSDDRPEGEKQAVANRVSHALNSPVGSLECNDLLFAIYVANHLNSLNDPFGQGVTLSLRTAGSGSPGRRFVPLEPIPGSGNTFYTVKP